MEKPFLRHLLGLFFFSFSLVVPSPLSFSSIFIYSSTCSSFLYFIFRLIFPHLHRIFLFLSLTHSPLYLTFSLPSTLSPSPSASPSHSQSLPQKKGKQQAIPALMPSACHCFSPPPAHSQAPTWQMSQASRLPGKQPSRRAPVSSHLCFEDRPRLRICRISRHTAGFFLLFVCFICYLSVHSCVRLFIYLSGCKIIFIIVCLVVCFIFN